MLDGLGSEPQESTSFTSPAFRLQAWVPIPGFIFTQTLGIKLWSSCFQDKHFANSCMAFCVCLKMKHIEHCEKGVQSGTAMWQRDDLSHSCLQ